MLEYFDHLIGFESSQPSNEVEPEVVNKAVEVFISTFNSELDNLFQEEEEEIAQIEEAERYAYMVAWKYYYTVTGSDCQTNQNFFEDVVLSKVRQYRFGR